MSSVFLTRVIGFIIAIIIMYFVFRPVIIYIREKRAERKYVEREEKKIDLLEKLLEEKQKEKK